MTLLLVAALLAGVVILTPLADRLRVPQPILLLIFGLILALLPGLPTLNVNASLILPVVLPPLLFSATQRATVEQFRDAAVPVLLMAVGLTVATAVVVAFVAHFVGLPWGAAAVLGAIVSPPDPVAATAVARRLRLPERIVTILEGEGMFNDATALVMYKVAVAVALTGEFSAGDAGVDLLLALGVGLGLGFILGWLTRVGLAALHHAAAETTVTLAVPFVAYLGAERLEGSGVLAVLVLGLYLRHTGYRSLTAAGWLLGRSVWDYADFLITSLVFVLLGFELTSVLEASMPGPDDWLLVGAVILAIVVFRPLWLFPAAGLARVLLRRHSMEVPYGWRETVVVSWAGMRGVVTVATALALPTVAADGTELSWRNSVVLAGLSCVLVTLLVEGLTLSPLVRRLGIGTDVHEEREIASLRRRALQAALDSLRAESAETDDPLHQAVIKSYEGQLEAQLVIGRVMTGRAVDTEDEVSGAERLPDLENELREVFSRARDVEREVVLGARSSGQVSPAAADEVLHDIEVRAAATGP